MTVYIKKLHKAAKFPKPATYYAGGWDVVCTEIEYKAPDFVIAKLGFALQLPVGYRAMIQPRSSLTGTNWLMQNSPGLCDCDYFGEYQIRFRALPIGVEYDGGMLGGKFKLKYSEFPYKVGDRVAQMYLERVHQFEIQEVQELNRIGSRDDAGYGTTGNSAMTVGWLAGTQKASSSKID